MSVSAPRVSVERGGSAQIITVEQGDITGILYVPQRASMPELQMVLEDLQNEATFRVAQSGALEL